MKNSNIIFFKKFQIFFKNTSAELVQWKICNTNYKMKQNKSNVISDYVMEWKLPFDNVILITCMMFSTMNILKKIWF